MPDLLEWDSLLPGCWMGCVPAVNPLFLPPLSPQKGSDTAVWSLESTGNKCQSLETLAASVFTHFTIHGNYSMLTSDKFLGCCVVQATSLTYKFLTTGNSGLCLPHLLWLALLRASPTLPLSCKHGSKLKHAPHQMEVHLTSDLEGSLSPRPSSTE